MNYAKIGNEVKERSSGDLKELFNSFSNVKLFCQRTDGIDHDFLLKVENIFDIIDREWSQK